MDSQASEIGSRERSRPGLSCAECRRSKLKCDRKFPCQTCIRRGCAAICPEGALAATKGNKILLSQNQTLNQKVKNMANRIKELESALKVSHSESSSSPHPLLANDRQSPTRQSSDHRTSGLAYHLTDVDEATDALGSLSLGDQGQARYYGETASSENLQDLVSTGDSIAFHSLLSSNLNVHGLPWQILELADAYPFGTPVRNQITMAHFEQYMPSKQVALKYTSYYYETLAWLYQPVAREDFMLHTIGVLYPDAPGGPPWDQLHCSQFSLFFMLMTMGALHDKEDPNPDVLASRYCTLAHAVFCLSPITKEASSVTVSTIVLGVYHLYQVSRTTTEGRWLLMGLACRIAHSLGLQRDSSGWNLSPDETQRRRVTFWELFTYDAYMSLVFGRPPAMNIDYTDCPFPVDTNATVRPSGEKEPSFLGWKYHHAVQCLAPSVRHIFSARGPDYASLLILDERIRKLPLPKSLHVDYASGDAWSTDPMRAMEQYCVICARETNLLYIHRSYFSQAIMKEPENPLASKYAPSVKAVYRSASILISSIGSLYNVHPETLSLVWFFWSGVFSSCIVLAGLVIASPGCSLSANACAQMDAAVASFRTGSAGCRPPTTLETLDKLQQRAHRAFQDFYSGKSSTHTSAGDGYEEPDNLHVHLGGTPLLINPNKSQVENTPSPESLGEPAEPLQQQSPQQPPQPQHPSPPPIWGDFVPPMAQAQGHWAPSLTPQQLFQSQGLHYFTPPPVSYPTTASVTQANALGMLSSDARLAFNFTASESSPGQPVPMDTEPTQAEIWQTFLVDLGIGHA